VPRKPRTLLGEVVCHHMVQGINREYIFETSENKRMYINLLKKYYMQFNINIIAYCIMDNHAHFLLYSDKIQNVSNFMRQANSIYAKYYNEENKRVGYVYRNRFKSVPIMTKKQLYACIKYIHMNPVKAGITQKEETYLYSSYKDYFSKTGFINEEILKFLFGKGKNYIEKFKSIQYEELDLEEEKVCIKESLNQFLIQKGKSLSEIKKDKKLLQQFVEHAKLNQWKFSKVELANILKISRATLYRKLDT